MNVAPLDIKLDWKKDKLGEFDFSECSYLMLWHYSSKTFDFTTLPDIPKLKKLSVTFSNIKNLNGLEKFPKLEAVEFTYLRNLETLDGIEKMSQRIKFFSIESAKKLTDISPVTKLENIEGLGFINIGDITDLEFLHDMYNIKSLSFVGTKIISGDLTPIINHFNIQHAGFDNKRHYSHKNEELALLLSKKERLYKT
ncbi:MAG: hypothetical protein IJZ72_08260 [Oscillospiraceae bacterium]|nr:hypothetical protein [Oscillospiraceae bacterium]